MARQKSPQLPPAANHPPNGFIVSHKTNGAPNAGHDGDIDEPQGDHTVRVSTPSPATPGALLAQTTKTPRTNLFKRTLSGIGTLVFGGTPQLNQAVDQILDDHSEEGSAPLDVEADIFGSQKVRGNRFGGDGAGDYEDDDIELRRQFGLVSDEPDVNSASFADFNYNSAALADRPIARNGMPMQRSEASSAELPRSSNPRIIKLKAKPAIYHDKSFTYAKVKASKPQTAKKDIYDVSDEDPAPPEKEIPQPTKKTVKGDQASHTSNINAATKIDAVTSENMHVQGAVSPKRKRRGRPPKPSNQEEESGLLPNLQSNPATRRGRGRPKSTQNEVGQSSHANEEPSKKVSAISRGHEQEDRTRNGFQEPLINSSPPKLRQNSVIASKKPSNSMGNKDPLVNRYPKTSIQVIVPNNLQHYSEEEEEDDHRPVIRKAFPSKAAKQTVLNESDDDFEEDDEDQPVTGKSPFRNTASPVLNGLGDYEDEEDQPVTSKPRPRTTSKQPAQYGWEDYLEDEEEDLPVSKPPSRNSAKPTQKRSDERLQIPRNKTIPDRPRKRLRTDDSDPDFNEETEDHRPQRKKISPFGKFGKGNSSQSQKKINLVRELAEAEETVRKRKESIKLKERELRTEQRLLAEDELAAKQSRNRLEEARARALAREREAQGLPPLEIKKARIIEQAPTAFKRDRRFIDLDDEEDFENGEERDEGGTVRREHWHRREVQPPSKSNSKSAPSVVDLDGDEEDFENGVERVNGVFGTNNLEHVANSVPFSDEEKAALIQGLWDERNAGPSRYYNVFKLPIFHQNKRSYDEVYAKILDFKRDMTLDWEKQQRRRDSASSSLGWWILNIPDE